MERHQAGTHGNRVLLVGLPLLLIIHLLTSFVPSVRSWGIDYWSEIPIWARLAATGLLAFSLISRFAIATDAAIRSLSTHRLSPLIGVLAIGAVFASFHSRGLAYGDGYSMAGLLDGGAPIQLTGNLLLMSGDLLTHRALHELIFSLLGYSARTTYAAVSMMAGMVSIVALMAIAKSLYPTKQSNRWFLVAGALASGSVVMWFGHVEAYSLTSAAILWSLAFAVRSVQSRASLIPAWILWAVAVLMHALALAFLPALLWCTMKPARSLPAVMQSRNSAFLVALAVMLASAVAAHVLNLAVPGTFVPLLTTSQSGYSAFSIDHLLDILNLMLFCAPLGILGVLAWLFGGRRSRDIGVFDHEADAQTVVVSISAASLWLFAFWVDPLIGAFRDWDLLGVFGIPMSLWAATVLVRGKNPTDQKWMNWVVVAVFAVAHVGGFVWSVQHEEASALRVDRMVRQDMHYSGRFHSGERRLSWADMLSRELGRDDLAKVHNQFRLSYAPTHSTAWHNLAVNFWNLGQPDSAIIAQAQAANYSPRNPSRWRELGQLCMKTGDLVCIRDAYEELLAIEDTSYSERNTLASVYIELGADSLASLMLERSIRQSPTRYEAHYLLGVLAERVGDSTGAVLEYQEAIRLGGELEDLKLRLSRLLPSTRP